MRAGHRKLVFRFLLLLRSKKVVVVVFLFVVRGWFLLFRGVHWGEQGLFL